MFNSYAFTNLITFCASQAFELPADSSLRFLRKPNPPPFPFPQTAVETPLPQALVQLSKTSRPMFLYFYHEMIGNTWCTFMQRPKWSPIFGVDGWQRLVLSYSMEFDSFLNGNMGEIHGRLAEKNSNGSNILTDSVTIVKYVKGDIQILEMT